MTLTPRHYQLEGIEYLTTPNVCPNVVEHDLHHTPTLCRHILSDAPGAGKTPQSIWAALAILSGEPGRGKSLPTPPANASVFIFAPAHLCKQWFDYLCEHWPEHRTVWLEGTQATRQRDSLIKAKFYIMSTQSMRHKHYVELATQVFIKQLVYVCILDESHYCKNPDAMSSKAIRTITRPEFCPHVICLTATPIMREADDLYMQLRICDPWSFHRQDIFMNTYCWFSYGNWKYTDVVLRKGALDKLRPWLWGRTYKDIGLELPPITPTTDKERVVSTELQPARRKGYDDLKAYWYIQLQSDEQGLSVNSAMECMHMLRHITACDEKAEPLSTYMSDDPGPYLVACFYRASARNLATYLSKHHPHMQVTVIDGSIDADERRELALKSSRSNNSVLVCTIPSIKEGVDLSHCNTVYFYEEDYTPGSMHQFLSRVQRHRNTPEGGYTIDITPDTDGNSLAGKLHVPTNPNSHPIVVRYFHANKTIDQRVHAVQSNRAVNAKDLIKLELAL